MDSHDNKISTANNTNPNSNRAGQIGSQLRFSEAVETLGDKQVGSEVRQAEKLIIYVNERRGHNKKAPGGVSQRNASRGKKVAQHQVLPQAVGLNAKA